MERRRKRGRKLIISFREKNFWDIRPVQEGFKYDAIDSCKLLGNFSTQFLISSNFDDVSEKTSKLVQN